MIVEQVTSRRTTGVKPAALQRAPRASLSRTGHLRPILFSIGDCTFLLIVGVLAVVAMHLAQRLQWNSVVCWLLGMALAMAIQMGLAFLVSPILGSIESMVPSMIVATVVPMVCEAAEMAGSNSPL